MPGFWLCSLGGSRLPPRRRSRSSPKREHSRADWIFVLRWETSLGESAVAPSVETHSGPRPAAAMPLSLDISSPAHSSGRGWYLGHCVNGGGGFCGLHAGATLSRHGTAAVCTPCRALLERDPSMGVRRGGLCF